MKSVFHGARIFEGDGFSVGDIYVSDGTVVPSFSPDTAASETQLSGLFLFPGFADVHVHLREPGFSYKETIKTGTLAAARGGYTAVCAMPNLDPAPDTAEHLDAQLDIIRRDACIHVLPYGTISMGERGETLSGMEALAPRVVAFSDDGRGVQSDSLMRSAMEKAKSLGKIIAAHCEDNSLLRSGYIHDGAYARAHGHRGICSESEWGQIKRDLALVKETGCAYHVCHVSTKESVALLRQAKREGLDVSCETAPHYLLLDDSMLEEDGRFKMNPPVRDKADREALIEGILDGAIDMVATDHAPHSAAEKARGLEKSLMGVVGLETAFPLLYTYLVKPGILPLARLIELLSAAPRRRFGLGTVLEPGTPADFSVWDLDREYEIDPAEFQSMGRATPFAGWKVCGRNKMTVRGGRIVWEEA
ncbi:MAG: dihydroorotase [Oscillospiraceae bacterium]|nr:dihydroorotase [Oscillospiraceae bacterium]